MHGQMRKSSELWLLNRRSCKARNERSCVGGLVNRRASHAGHALLCAQPYYTQMSCMMCLQCHVLQRKVDGVLLQSGSIKGSNVVQCQDVAVVKVAHASLGCEVYRVGVVLILIGHVISERHKGSARSCTGPQLGRRLFPLQHFYCEVLQAICDFRVGVIVIRDPDHQEHALMQSSVKHGHPSHCMRSDREHIVKAQWSSYL